MPIQKSIVHFEFARNKLSYSRLSIANKKGFSLIEILLAMVVMVALIGLLFSVSGTYFKSRSSDLQTTATSIAEKRMEDLRNGGFTNLPSSGSFADSNLSRLPQGTATQTISNYSGDSTIDLVTIQVNWVENTANKNIKIESFFTKGGI